MLRFAGEFADCFCYPFRENVTNKLPDTHGLSKSLKLSRKRIWFV